MAGSFLELSPTSHFYRNSSHEKEKEKDDRKRKRETALVSFDRTGSIEGLSSLAITDCPAPQMEPSMIVRPSHTPMAKGILKMRPILKGAQQERHKSKSFKKRKVLFDEKTLEELQKEKEHEPPKRKVDEHNTPYHDTYHHLPGDEDDPPVAGLTGRRITPPSPKEGSHLHFHFNVQFNFTKPKMKSKVFLEKTKELILEEGQMFKLMVKAKLPEPDDMEDDEMDSGSIEKMLKAANLPAPSFWGQCGGGFPAEDATSPMPLSPISPSAHLSQSPTSPLGLHGPPPGRFLFHSVDEVARHYPDAPVADAGALFAASDAFVFSAPPSSLARPRSFTYCSGGGGSTG
eukprot:GGOE01019139.1.p1 GENE.GGOE01019139.1~~GGOE01019139.1.p1  ORF type:complete len:345 (+),score=110.40 GGOE01019139.1:57-1091(+)